LKGKCGLGSFLSVLVIKYTNHHFELTYYCEYELRVKLRVLVEVEHPTLLEKLRYNSSA
jgi:hypothetical protein